MAILKTVITTVMCAGLIACSSLGRVHSQTDAETTFSQRTPEERARLASFLNLELYVYETVVVSPALTQEHFNAHLDYQIHLEKTGVLYGAGPLYDGDTGRPSAGLVIVRAESMEQAKAIADADPMHASGARSYSMRRWKLNEGALNVTLNFSDQTLSVER